MELRRKSKEKKKNELTGQQSSFQNWEVTTKVEKHNSTYLNMMTWKLSPCCFFKFQIQACVLKSQTDSTHLVPSFSCVAFLLFHSDVHPEITGPLVFGVPFSCTKTFSGSPWPLRRKSNPLAGSPQEYTAHCQRRTVWNSVQSLASHQLRVGRFAGGPYLIKLASRTKWVVLKLWRHIRITWGTFKSGDTQASPQVT